MTRRWLRGHSIANVYVEEKVKAELLEDSADFGFIQTYDSEKQSMDMEKRLDLIITLGGDGTMLWASVLYSSYA